MAYAKPVSGQVHVEFVTPDPYFLLQDGDKAMKVSPEQMMSLVNKFLKRYNLGWVTSKGTGFKYNTEGVI
jgi:hypothetical protein